jgi:hypothetical protein
MKEKVVNKIQEKGLHGGTSIWTLSKTSTISDATPLEIEVYGPTIETETWSVLVWQRENKYE